MEKKTVFISGDHAGFKLKEKLKPFLEKKEFILIDLGPFEYNLKDDYPDFVIPMAKKVAKHKNSVGIVIAGSGIGEVIASNRVGGVRAVLFHGKANKKFLETSRIHDNTNVLCFGSRFVTEAEAKKGIKIWLDTKFTGQARHKRRLKKIEDYSKRK